MSVSESDMMMGSLGGGMSREKERGMSRVTARVSNFIVLH